MQSPVLIVSYQYDPTICSMILIFTRSGLYSQDLKDAMAPLQMNRFILYFYVYLYLTYPSPALIHLA